MTESEVTALKTIIVDDEELARQGLSMRLEQYGDINVVQECKNGREAIEAIIEHEPEILFLDIQMPGMTGFEMIKQVQGDVMPMIIFLDAIVIPAQSGFGILRLKRWVMQPVYYHTPI